jgi:hypothetical protein
MDGREIRKLLSATPFAPFTVVMVNNKSFTVRHPEFALLTPNGRTLIIAPESDEGVDMLDVPLISRVEKGKKPAPKRK